MASKYMEQCKAFLASSTRDKRIMDGFKLMRNRSLVDVRSQLLHRSLVEEVNKRRMFNTVGAVENIGFQAPCEVSKPPSQKKTAASGKGQGHQSRR